MGLQGVRRGPGRPPLPEQVGDPVGGHRLVRVDEEQCEQGAQARPAHVERLRAVSDRERTQNAELRHHHPAPPRPASIVDQMSACFKRCRQRDPGRSRGTGPWWENGGNVLRRASSALLGVVVGCVCLSPPVVRSAPAGAGPPGSFVSTQISQAPPGLTFAFEVNRELVSSDGRFVAYTGHETSDTGVGFGVDQVFMYDRQTGTTTLVTHDVADPTAPSNGATWSLDSITRDGRYFSFNSDVSNITGAPQPPSWGGFNLGTFVADRTTGTITVVAVPDIGEPISEVAGPYLSGDGTTTVFAIFGQTTNTWTLAVGDWHTGTYQLLRTFGTDEIVQSTAFSADGSTLAYTVLSNSGAFEGYVGMYDVGSCTETAKQTVGYMDARISLSGDGHLLTYVTVPAAANQLWLLNSDNPSNPVQIDDPGGLGDHAPALSTDGSTVAFSSTGSDGIDHVYVASPPTSTAELVTTDPATAPAATDDGSAIAYRSGGALYFARAAGHHRAVVRHRVAHCDADVDERAAVMAGCNRRHAVSLYHEVRANGVAFADLDPATSYLVSGLTPSTPYGFSVVAYDLANNASAPLSANVSTQGSGTTGWDAGLLASLAPGGVVDLSWSAAPGDVVGYKVERATMAPACALPIATGRAGTATFHDTGLLASTSYTYEIDTVAVQLDSRHVHRRRDDPDPCGRDLGRRRRRAVCAGKRGSAALGGEMLVTLRGEPNRVATAEVVHPTPARRRDRRAGPR